MSKKIGIFVAVSLILAIAVSALRTYMLATVVEVETGLYANSAQWAGFFEIFLLVLVAALIVCGNFVFGKTETFAEPDSSNTFTVFGSGLCAFMYAALFIGNIFALTKGVADNALFVVLQTVLCIPCALNHLNICAKEKREKSTTQSVLAVSTAVFFAFRIIDVFMNVKTQINASQRSLELLMLCAIMLFCLYEADFTVEKKEVSKKAFAKYFTLAIATVLLVLVAVVPYLLASMLFMFERTSLLLSVLECCIMIYAIARIFTMKIKASDK